MSEEKQRPTIVTASYTRTGVNGLPVTHNYCLALILTEQEVCMGES